MPNTGSKPKQRDIKVKDPEKAPPSKDFDLYLTFQTFFSLLKLEHCYKMLGRNQDGVTFCSSR